MTSRYTWIPEKPLVRIRDGRRGYHESPRRLHRLVACVSCGLEFSRERKTCPACLCRRERTDAA